MTPAQLEDLRRFANEGFPSVGRLLDAYESAQAELAAVRGGVVRGGVVLEDLTETEIEAVWARVRTYDYQHRSMAQRFVDELNEEIRTRLRSAPEGTVLVDAGELELALGSIEAFFYKAAPWLDPQNGAKFDGDLCEIVDRRLVTTLNTIRDSLRPALAPPEEIRAAPVGPDPGPHFYIVPAGEARIGDDAWDRSTGEWVAWHAGFGPCAWVARQGVRPNATGQYHRDKAMKIAKRVQRPGQGGKGGEG